MDAIQSESTVKWTEIYFNSLIDGDVICPQFQVNVNFVYFQVLCLYMTCEARMQHSIGFHFYCLINQRQELFLIRKRARHLFNPVNYGRIF